MLSGLLAVGPGLELRQVAVIVALHLEVEDLGFAGGCGGDQVVVQQLQDALADLAELFLHLGGGGGGGRGLGRAQLMST